MIDIDARGLDCPIPVIKTKKALAEAKDGTITLVDNQIAVENLEKMAKELGYDVNSKKIEDKCFQVEILLKGNGSISNVVKKQESAKGVAAINDDSVVVAVDSQFMGNGDDELGKALMKSFIYTLSEKKDLPKEIIFYNGGVKVCKKDSSSLDDLKTLEQKGVKIYCCGACVNFYNLQDEIGIGEITNMMVIVEKLFNAGKVVKP